MLRRIAGMNYFIALIILLAIILFLVVAAFGLVTTLPGPLGAAPSEFEIKEIYSFEPWTFELGELTVSFPEGGIIIPAYKTDRQEAALLLGQGDYSISDGKLPVEEPVGLYLMLNQELFDEKRGDIIFLPVEDESIRAEAMRVYEKQPGLPVLWQNGIPLVFKPGGNSAYYYFLDSTGEPAFQPFTFSTPWSIYGTALIYSLIFMVIILTMLVFSLDHKPSRYWSFIHCARPNWVATSTAAAAAALALGGELLPVITGWPEATLSLGYAAAAIGLIILARQKKIDFLDFGIRPDMLKHGYLMAGAALAIIIFLTRGLPKQLSINGFSSVVDFLTIFTLIAVAREIIWRGYIQTTLSRKLGASAGIAITVILAGLVHYIVLSINIPWMLEYPYTLVETLVLVPGTAAVLGYLYLRTENILCCALLHSLILFLPRIIIS
ncbi:MAG: CPBP family intramembrane glutamic endopeptidase [Bacillota bacterium]